MLNTILVFCWILSLVAIFYFWKKRPNRTYKRISIVISILLVFCIALLPSNRQYSGSSSASSSSTSSKAYSKSASKKPYKPKQKQANNSSSYDEARLKGFAQAFGRKPVDDIQKMPSVYTTNRVGDKTVYGWHPQGLPELVRVDDPNTSNTDVYLYDEHGQGNMLGRHLYTGRTIFQHQPRYVPQY